MTGNQHSLQEYESLEQEWAVVNGIDPHCMTVCSSGTAALHLALETLRHKFGWTSRSEVLVPDFTFVACARAVVLAGLTPIFIDCGPDLTLDTELLQLATSATTVAIMPVHLYGRRCNMDAISD